MERFQGRLRDGDRIIFERVTGYLEVREGRGRGTASGSFEVHQGGILGGDLPTDRPCHLDLDDGRSGTIRPTKVRSSNSAGIARVVVASIDTYLKYADAVGLSGLVAKPQLTAPVETEVVVRRERPPARRPSRR